MQYRIERMPRFEFGGKQVHASTPLLYACFIEFDRGQIPFEKFHTDFMATTEAVWDDKTKSGKEILSSTRFERFLEKLDADLGKRKHEIHRLLMDIHLTRVAKCLELLPVHRGLLFHWQKQYRLGLVTNFDDAKTVQHVLTRDGIDRLFQSIIISAEMGIRKPCREIFSKACGQLDASPDKTLFIGDNWTDDIIGAKGLGMDTAWINPDRLPQPEGTISTDYDLSDLAELEDIV